MLTAPGTLLRASSSLSAAAALVSMLTPPGRRGMQVPPASRRELSHIAADLYVPDGGPWPGVVLVVGALREGRRYPLLERAARAVAGCGFAVLVPELGRLRRLVLGMDALDDLVRAAQVLPLQAGVRRGPVGLVGFSLGGSLGLLAAADERVGGRVACVADLGGYFRLEDMLTAATTGALDGSPVTLEAPSVFAVAASLAGLAPEPDSSRIQAALDAHRETPLEVVANIDESTMDSRGRAVIAVLRNRDPALVPTLLDAIDGAVAAMTRLSPESVLGRVEVPVWVLHDARDRYVPAEQSELMRRAAAGRTNFHFFRTRLLEHTEPTAPTRNPVRFAGDYLPGLVSMFRFVRGPMAAMRKR